MNTYTFILPFLNDLQNEAKYIKGKSALQFIT